MTTEERRALVHGVIGGMIMGLTLGLISALFIAMKPHFFANLIG